MAVFQVLMSGQHNASVCDTDHLMREYIAMMKASFDRVFGRNATRAQDIIAAELLSRGVTEIPNIFGAIEVRRAARG